MHAPDVALNGGHVQTWDCNGGPNQAWSLEPAGRAPVPPPPPPPGRRFVPPPPPPPAPTSRDVEAGPIWNNDDARRKCPAVCAPAPWTGQWRTVVSGRQSVCSCSAQVQVDPVPVDPGAPPPPGPMDDGRFAALLQAIQAEAFSEGKIRVIQEGARSDYFLVAQLRRIIEGLTFSPDKIKAVELIAPRLLDRNNAFTLYSVFTFDSEKEQARRILERN